MRNQGEGSRRDDGELGREHRGGMAAAGWSNLRGARSGGTSRGSTGRGSTGRNPNDQSRGGPNERFAGRDGVDPHSRGRAGRGRGRGSNRGRGQWRAGRRPRRTGDEADSNDEDGGDAIDDGFIIIGRADRPAASTALAQDAAASASAGSSSSSPLANVAADRDALDGSRFWIEASGIDDLDEEDEEDEEDDEEEEGEGGEGADGGQGDDDDEVPKTPEELLENMRRQGFTLQQLAADALPPRAQEAATAADASGATPSAELLSSAPAPVVAPAAVAAVSEPSGTAGAALALRDLRDTFIATMKPPLLPPWFLGPVEVAAAALVAAAAAPKRTVERGVSGPTGRGVALRTTQAVAPGELLAVSLPLAICYCRQGTTPENEDLADAMLAVGCGDAAVATAPGTAPPAALASSAPAPDRDPTVVVSSTFSGLTDLQHSLLGCLWRGHDALDPPPPQHQQQEPEDSASAVSDPVESTAVTARRLRARNAGRSGSSNSGNRGGSSSSSGGPVRRAFLQMVARSAADAGSPRSPPLVTAPELHRLVNLNCLGEDFQDLALCELRGEVPQGHIALWPEAAFTAHSCAPNATAYTLGDRLLIRAAVDIPKGGEVSLNWLGSLLTAPLEVRRHELRQQYGFTCGCVRCTAEARYSGSPLAELLDSIYAACQEISPRLECAITAGDMAVVAAARSELQGMQTQVESAMRTASPKVNSKIRRWLQACVYDMYDMISLCSDELAAAAALGNLKALLGGGDSTEPAALAAGRGQGRGRAGSRGGSPAVAAADADPVETESLVQCARVVEGVTPGSDGHVYLAAELVMRSLQRFGPQHEEYRQARAALVRAYGIRYGSVGPEVMELLVAARLAAEAREDGEGEYEDTDADRE